MTRCGSLDLSASPHLKPRVTPHFNLLQSPRATLGHFPCPYQVLRGHTAIGPFPSGLNLTRRPPTPASCNCAPSAYSSLLPALLEMNTYLLSLFLTD